MAEDQKQEAQGEDAQAQDMPKQEAPEQESARVRVEVPAPGQQEAADDKQG